MTRSLAPAVVSTWLMVTVAAPMIAGVGSRPLTFDAIFSPDPDVRVDFEGSPPGRLAWSSDSRYLLRSQGPGRKLAAPLRIEAANGRSQVLFEMGHLSAALVSQVGFPQPEADRLLERQVTVAPDADALLIERAGDLFYYSIADRRARRLTRSDLHDELATFSPDGRAVSFVRGGDLYSVEIAAGRVIALVADDRPETLNGKLDWVYQEEIYGRGDFRGHWWSPDSTRIAFLELDESEVALYTLVDHLPARQQTEDIRYPKAGEPNPGVRLGVVPAAGGEPVWVEPSRYADVEHLIVRVGWTPTGQVVFLVQDREQTWLDINLADPITGETTTLLRDDGPVFIDIDLTGTPLFLGDGSFLWISGRNGYHHLYHFDAAGAVIRQLTEGAWEVRQLHGYDAGTGWIYLSASAHSPIEDHVYRLRLDGSHLERLSLESGHHEARFAPNSSHYVDLWSDYDTPPQVSLHRPDGSLVRKLDENRISALESFELPSIEFMQVPAPDGFVMEAALIRPPDFDPRRRYPVLQFNYGGPHSRTVLNKWGGSRHLWLRFLAQEGIVVWMCDNRSASAKGIWPTWEIHGRLGEVELEDIEACLDWLHQKSWVDAERVGIFGSSYGGFLSAYALTHSSRFKVGIAFAPVTDWHLYDTVYTERYMGRPQDNPTGYRSTSVLEAAARLQGHLLLMHGTMDDNVHFQNTLKLADALQRADKDFDLMIYPTARHSVRDRFQIRHWYRLMTRFLMENL